MKCEKLFGIIDSMAEEYLSVLEDVCNIESPSDFKEGVDAVGRYFIRRAEKFGWDIDICRQEVSGDCVCITMNPDAQVQPVVLSGHMDTVHPLGSFGTPAVRIADGKLYGPGAEDCKGGIVTAFLAMAALDKLGFISRPVKLLLQSDEEVSSITSGKATVRYMAEKSRGCIAFLNCEPTESEAIIIERKAIVRYVLEVTGRAVHSSICYDGANAVAEAAHKIIELEKWKQPDGITCNCSVISGGSVPNTVAEKCTFIADIRYKNTSDFEAIDAKVREIAAKSYISGTKCTVSIKSQRLPMERNQRNIDLYKRISEVFAQNGLSPRTMSKGNGGSDAADMSSYGIPCVDNMGIKGGRCHSADEYIETASIADTAKRLAAIIYCI